MDKTDKVEIIVKTISKNGVTQTIKFNLSDVTIDQNRDMVARYNEDGTIHEYVENPESEGVDLIIKGKIKKHYEN